MMELDLYTVFVVMSGLLLGFTLAIVLSMLLNLHVAGAFVVAAAVPLVIYLVMGGD